MAIQRVNPGVFHQVTIGDLRHHITIQTRSLTPNNNGTADFVETFTTVATPWAAVSPLKGVDMFGAVAEPGTTPTHSFTIRFIPNITQEHWIIYRAQFYDIMNIINSDERSQYLIMLAKVRGITTTVGSNT